MLNDRLYTGGELYRRRAMLCPDCNGLEHDPQDEADVLLGRAVREWLGIYGITAHEIRGWMADPLIVERLTAQCAESLYRRLATALEAEQKGEQHA